jgi:phospholipase/carboxylesterase
MLDHRLLPAAERNSKRLLVMMHGLGDSFAGYLWMPEVLRLPWLNYALPNAPDDYYGGYSWFDIYNNAVPGVRRSRELVFELLDHLRAEGWPTEQTVLGGFSQGGLMAIEVGLRYPHRFAGVLSISGFVCEPEKLVRELSPVAREQRVLATHGTLDPLLPIATSRRQIQQLQQAGLNLAWHEFRKEHTIAGEEEISLIRDFIAAGYSEPTVS